MKPRLLPIAFATAALLPASASAAQPWSAPVDVIANPGAPAIGNSAPEAFVAGGRSLVVAGSGQRALLARGSVSNVFSEPIAVATAPSGDVGTDAAVGADGTVAVGWAAGGTGHVSIVKPDGSVLGQADLPGAGVNAIAVGIASDGSTIVAFRTKESANAYSLRVATAAPGSATFGDPQVVVSGAATDSYDIATGPGGAAAVAYRKLAGKYRARVAVRPAGASAFGAEEVLPNAGDQDDYSPRVAYDADGTLVAAWGSAAGGQYALRPAGAVAFGAPVALGAGSAYDVDLEPTPGGVAVVGLAGGGAMRVSSQPGAGAAFGAAVPVGAGFQSQFSGDIAVTTTPAGVTTAVYADPTTGEVHAIDVGGEDKVIGYGGKDTLTPVELASGGDRTVAVWTNATGAISVATRSASVKPATADELGPRPTGRDTVAPKVRYVSGSKRFRVTAKTTTVRFKVRCSEACKVGVSGSLRTVGAGGRKNVGPLPPAKPAAALKSGVQTVSVKLGTFARRELRKALARGRGAQLFLVLEASDASANSARTRLQLTLKPAKAKHHR